MEYLVSDFWFFRALFRARPAEAIGRARRHGQKRSVVHVWSVAEFPKQINSWHPLTTNQQFSLQRDLFFPFLLRVFCPFKTSSHGFCLFLFCTCPDCALNNQGDLWRLTRWSRRSRRSIRGLCGEWNRNVRHVRLEMQQLQRQPRAEIFESLKPTICATQFLWIFNEFWILIS